MSYSVNLSLPRVLALVGGVITLAGFFAMPWVNAFFLQMTAFDVAQQLTRSSGFQERSMTASLDVLLIYVTPLIGLTLVLTVFTRSEQGWSALGGIASAIVALLLIVEANQSSAFRLAQPGSGYGAATLGLVLGAIAGVAALAELRAHRATR